jgi:hypothetical protein
MQKKEWKCGNIKCDNELNIDDSLPTSLSFFLLESFTILLSIAPFELLKITESLFVLSLIMEKLFLLKTILLKKVLRAAHSES